MSQLRCWLAQAARSIRAGLLIQLASTGAIAIGLLLVGLVLLFVLNIGQLTRQWDDGFQLTVYLAPEAPPGQVDRLVKVLQRHRLVRSVRHISSRQAFARLREGLGDRHNLLVGVEESFLPASLELNLRQSAPERVRPLVALLTASRVVEEVDYMGRWIERISSLATLVRAAALGIALVVALACLYIVGSTIRLGVYARREEIAILKLVGATDRYVRAPFLMEGVLQGVVGALAAAGLLYALFHLAAPRVEDLLAAALSYTGLDFFTPAQLALGLAGGALLGLLGSRLALGRCYVNV